MFRFEDAEEKAGHELTILSHIAGTALYFCENCGGIMVLDQSELRFFHAPRGSFSVLTKCMKAGNATGAQDKRTLKQKMHEMMEESMRKMEEI